MCRYAFVRPKSAFCVGIDRVSFRRGRRLPTESQRCLYYDLTFPVFFLKVWGKGVERSHPRVLVKQIEGKQN